MNWTARRHRFRQILAGNDCITPATVFDPLSARMIEDLGGQVGMLAGSVAAMSILGAPDKMLITASEFADMALRICRAGDLAVIADADHGYGNAMNVQRTIRELDHSGLAAITIEDTDLPQPFGSEATQLLNIDEAVGKMRAAVSGRVDANLVILARTSAATITGNGGRTGPCQNNQIGINTPRYSRPHFANRLINIQKLCCLRSKRLWQISIFNGDCGKPRMVKFADCALYIHCIAIAVIRIGNNRQITRPANPQGHIGKL